jgi:hypothetical protein
MSHYLVCRIEQTPNIEVRKRSEVTGIGRRQMARDCLPNES